MTPFDSQDLEDLFTDPDPAVLEVKRLLKIKTPAFIFALAYEAIQNLLADGRFEEIQPRLDLMTEELEDIETGPTLIHFYRDTVLTSLCAVTQK